jgi:flagellar assembly factor FliW
MSIAVSRNFGVIGFSEGDEFVFDGGLPGFPLETAFLPVEMEGQFPLLYLQSLRTPELCFVALPVKCLVPDYTLSVSSGDLTAIGLNDRIQPGPELLCLALVCFDPGGTASANLRAPLLINVKSRRGIQSIQPDDRYPIRFALEAETEGAVCS